MQALELLRTVAVLAPGVSLELVTAEGDRYALPLVVQEPLARPPDQLETVSRLLLERDEQARREAETMAVLMSTVVSRVDDTLNAVKQSVDTVAAAQSKVARSMTRLEGTLHLPVKPIYDKDGKLIGAARSSKQEI